MKNYNYYEEFNQDPEILFIAKKSRDEFSFHLWEGYFDEIMKSVPTNEEGKWEGFTLLYHLHEGWYEQNSWGIGNIEEVIQQIKSSIVSEDNKLLYTIKSDLIDFLTTAKKEEFSIAIIYQ
jgi:hypothetical protein